MAITNNLFKLRSSLVRYTKFDETIPKDRKTKFSKKFSDIDMFHTYKGHRMFVELKHERARYKHNRGVQQCLLDMFQASMAKGEFCIILWGTYKDFNKNTPEYYSEFVPTSARIYNPHRGKIIEYLNISGYSWFKQFMIYWYGYCESHPIEDYPIVVTEEEYEF